MEQVIEQPEVKPEVKETKAKKVEAEGFKKVRLTINSGEDEAEKGDVALSHNYKQVLVQRDVEVIIGEQYVNSCLKDAVIKSEFKDGNGVMRSTSVPRFSYTVSPL